MFTGQVGLCLAQEFSRSFGMLPSSLLRLLALLMLMVDLGGEAGQRWYEFAHRTGPFYYAANRHLG
jgi:hypothetical protein